MEALRRLFIAVILALASLAFAVQVSAEEANLFVNGEEIQTEVSPILEDGTTLVPVRFVTEALGAKVIWDDETQSVFISGPAVVALKIGSKQASKDGSPVELLHEPLIINERTMVPVRFITEAFGCNVNWDDGRISIDQPGAQTLQPVPIGQEGVPIDNIRLGW